MHPPLPTSTLFPYTTLFRSLPPAREGEGVGVAQLGLREERQPAPVLEPPEVFRPRAAQPACVRRVIAEASECGAHPLEDQALEPLAVESFELGLEHPLAGDRLSKRAGGCGARR